MKKRNVSIFTKELQDILESGHYFVIDKCIKCGKVR